MSLVYEDDWLTVHGGDCRSVMLSMSPGSVDCIITSPPYWGLRDYGVEPQLWGETRPCVHEWGPMMPDPHVSGQSVGGSLGADKAGGGRAAARDKTAGQFCQLCGAWYGNLGLEPTPDLYVTHLVEVFDAAWHVLKPTGTLWLNLGDSFAAGKQGRDDNDAATRAKFDGHGHGGGVKLQAKGNTGKARKAPAGLKPKDLAGVPWMAAFALRSAGWYLRSDIVWAKPNPMPESVTDRPQRTHEFVFLLTKSERYTYDYVAVREAGATGPWAEGMPPIGGKKQADGQNKTYSGNAPVSDGSRNMRDVWFIATRPYADAHFAVFPPSLVERCVKAGCPKDGVVMDPFAGSGTVGLVAQSLSRRAVLIDLQPDYLVQQFKRAGQTPLGLEV